MRKNTTRSLCVLVLLCGMIIPINVIRGATDEKSTFYGIVHKQANYLDSNFNPGDKGALRDQPKSSDISTMTNSLAASILFDEYKKGGSTDLLNNAHRIVKASSEYFRLNFHSDRRGWVASYDFAKEEESFVKSRKYTHDQFFMALGLANSYLNLDQIDARRPDYLDDFNKTIAFIEEYLLESDEKWIDSVFTFNETRYTQNKLRLVEHISWTIWASLNLPPGFSSPISIDESIQMLDFLDTSGTLNGAIYNVLSPDGNSTDHIFKLRTNALYGIINLLVYEKTADLGIANRERFLTRGKVVFDFLVDNLWDRGFKLFFDAVDEDGLLLVRGKSLMGNSLACLLASRLCRYYPTNEAIKSIYVLSNSYIDQYLQASDKFQYYISCDSDGDPLLTPLTLESNLLRLWQRSNTLHIINGSYVDQVSIGEKIQIDLNLDNPDNLTYEVTVTGDEIDTFTLNSSETQISLPIQLKKNAEIGSSEIEIEIKVSNELIDTSDSLSIKIGSDRRLPQGLIYLVALGILVGMVVIARYPPKGLEDLISRLASIGVTEEDQPPSDDSSVSKDEETLQDEE